MSRDLYVGLMSGTSLDGVDAVLVDLGAGRPRLISSAHLAFEPALRGALLALCSPGADEVARAAALGNELAQRYAAAVHEVLQRAGVHASSVRAVGCHGQTIRHRPELGYSVQIGNAALLAELCGATVVADFRSRDLAAGGQGAPLAPAFHAGVFASREENRVVLNLGGIANLTWLPREGQIRGFDCGPANCLLDLWAARHLGQPFDAEGAWGGAGEVIPALLARMLREPFFAAPPPKSTGRELFNEAWLALHVGATDDARSVQATLLELTAASSTDAIRRHCPHAALLIVCGGGTRNDALMRRLERLAAPLPLESSERHGVDPDQVEATAFAWLAKQTIEGNPASLPAVTGASGARILGAVYRG